MSPRELVLLIAGLSVVAASLFGVHVLDGGFYVDDWANQTVYRLLGEPHFLNAVRFTHRVQDPRPLLAYFKFVPVALFGLHIKAHLLAAAAIGVAVSAASYVVARSLTLEVLPAAAIAVLSLLFPWSDSVHLWATASINEIAVLLYLIGLLLALGGLRARRRRAVIWHLGALACYSAAILTYEAVGGLILAGGLLYLTRARLYAIRVRWLADIAVAGPLLIYSAHHDAAVRARPSLSVILRDTPPMAQQALDVTVGAIDPITPVPGLLVLAVAGLTIWQARRRPHAASRASLIRHWLRVAALALLFTALAYLPFVGSGLHPLDGGLNNRGNLVVALTTTLLLVALIRIVTLVWVADARRRSGIAAILVTFVAAGYWLHVHDDVTQWDHAADLQRNLLGNIHFAIPRPPPHATILITGYPADVAPGVAVFSQTWDLTAATRLLYKGQLVIALPIFAGGRLVCDADGAYPSMPSQPYDILAGGEGPAHKARYSRSFLLLDAPAMVVRPMTDRQTCTRAAQSLRLAPVVGGPL